jgi:hypothetical protein
VGSERLQLQDTNPFEDGTGLQQRRGARGEGREEGGARGSTTGQTAPHMWSRSR